MKINKIHIENFLSIADQEIDFEACNNLVRVWGLNQDTNPTSSNGAGKSSMIEAILFALFGKTLRKTTEKSLKNFHTKGRCRVTLTVNDNVVITRVKKPPLLKVEVGDKNVTEDCIAKTQEQLNKILNTNLNVFLASMVFGQQNSMNFLTASAEEKREIIQSFLNLSDLFKHRSSIRSLKSKCNERKRVASTLLDESLNKVSSLDKQIEKVRKNKKDIQTFFTKEQLEYLKTHTFSDIKEHEAMVTEKKLELREGEMVLTQLIKDAQRVKQRLRSLGDKNCEHCGLYPSDLQETITSSEERYNDLKDQESLKRKMVSQQVREVDSLVIPVTTADFDLVESFNSHDAKLKFFRYEKIKQRKLSTKYGAEVTNAQKRYDILRYWEKAFSEQGLVKYVIRNILEYFNEKVNFYLGVLSKGAFSISFDDSLSESLYHHGSEVYFGSLSGGEKKRTSLAVTLGLNDLLMLSGKDQSNIVFFDEVADSLDSVGVRGLHDLIMDVVERKKLFIITHNDYLTSLIEEDADVLQVEKKKDITTFKYK